MTFLGHMDFSVSYLKLLSASEARMQEALRPLNVMQVSPRDSPQQAANEQEAEEARAVFESDADQLLT